MLEVTNAIRIPLDEFEWSFARSGGPGGQNVNKVASKAVLRWDFERTPSVPDAVKARFRERFPSRLTTQGEVVLSSELTRDQGRNREDCRPVSETFRKRTSGSNRKESARRAILPSTNSWTCRG